MPPQPASAALPSPQTAASASHAPPSRQRPDDGQAHHPPAAATAPQGARASTQARLAASPPEPDPKAAAPSPGTRSHAPKAQPHDPRQPNPTPPLGPEQGSATTPRQRSDGGSPA